MVYKLYLGKNPDFLQREHWLLKQLHANRFLVTSCGISVKLFSLSDLQGPCVK